MSIPLQRESALESDIRKYAIKRGWYIMKFTSPGKRAVPDRLMIRQGVHVFMEVKRLGEIAEPQQEKRHREMRDAGATVHVVDNMEQAIVILT